MQHNYPLSNNLNFQLAQAIFPYEYKGQQKELLKELVNNSKILLHAPTGYGKTVLALVSALTYLLGQNRSITKIIIFVRMKTQIFRIMDECIKISTNFFNNYDKIKNHFDNANFPNELISIPLFGKPELCIYPNYKPLGNIDCKGLNCKFFKAPLPKGSELNSLITDYFFKDLKSSEEIKTFLMEETPACCPYYTLRSMLAQSQIIVTTHAWLLNPQLRESLFKEFNLIPSQTAIIIDEVHNFRSHITAKLSYTQLAIAESFAYNRNLDIKHFITDIVNIFKKLPLTAIKPIVSKDDWRLEQLQLIITQLRQVRLKNKEEYEGLRMLEILHTFLTNSGDFWYFDKEIEIKQDKSYLIKVLKRVMPFPELIFQEIKSFKRILLMSGTLYPPEAYMTLFGLDNTFVVKQIPQDNQNITFSTYVQFGLSSRNKDRSIRLLQFQIEKIIELYHCNPQHTIVFSTSHNYTNFLIKIIEKKYPYQEIYFEGTSANNQIILEKLRILNHKLIFTTLGGSLSEGIEILDRHTKRSKITLIIFTGIPIPPPTILEKLLENLYIKKYGKLKSLIFLKWLPIYQALLQAAGRGIRSPFDQCAVVCLDYRLPSLNIFPKHKMLISSDWNQVLKNLKDFYSNTK